VTDRAAEEAARAEAEQDDEPVTAPDEGVAPGDDDEANEAAEQEEGAGESPETEDVPPSSETTMEQRSKQLAAAHKSFTTRIATVMEEDANALQPCPLCWPMTQGFVWPGMPVEEDRKLAVKMVMGELGADQYEEDPAREQCPQCKGRGMLKTGSLVQGQDALNCRRCNGHGFVDVPNAGTAPNGDASAIWTTPPPVAAGIPAPPPDQWGRPFGHPHFGQHPSTVGV